MERTKQKAKVEKLARSGLSLAEIGRRAGVPKSTAARWLRKLEPGPDTDAPVAVSAPVPDDGSDPDALDVVDFENIEFLKEERARLYAALSQGYDRSAAIQLAMINKDLRELRTCENHWTVEDVRRLCASLNDTWLRQLEIASRDMTQVGQTNATRILDRAIRKVEIEAETLT